MKAVLLFALLAMAFAFTIAAPVADCDAEGVPVCTADAVAGTTYRDNWDPVHYWVCDGATPVQKACTVNYLYDASLNKCVADEEWTWTPVCA